MKILVIGGRGYVGSQVVRVLKKSNLEVYTADRSSGNQTHRVINIIDSDSIMEQTKDIDIIINTVGLSPLKKYTYKTYYNFHVVGVQNILKAAKKNKIKKIIHISALGVHAKAKTSYLKTKYLAEKKIIASKIPYTILRPSVIISKNSELIPVMKRFARLHFMIDTPSKLQPIKREDVANIIVKVVNKEIKEKIINVAGPEVFSLKQLTKAYTKAIIIAIPWNIARPFVWLVTRIINPDLYIFVQLQNITKDNHAQKYGCARRIMK